MTQKNTAPKTLYLNEWEQKASYRKMIEINNKLAELGMRGISKESQLIHKIIEIGLAKAEVSENGTIIIT
nr:hypothetical protein [uncultured Moraxella sp.]